MSQLLVDIAIINKSLLIHQYTPLEETLLKISQLVGFKKNHQLCSNIIFTMQNQIAKLKVSLNQQTNQYIKQKIEMAKIENTQLFKMKNNIEKNTEIKIKTYPIFQSFEQFAKKEYDLAYTKKIEKSTKLKINHSFSQCIVPLELSIESIQLKKERNQVALARELTKNIDYLYFN